MANYAPPDFRTLNRFRSVRLADGWFDSIFTQVVELLTDCGVVSWEQQVIDGTKIESVANRYTIVWRRSVEKNRAKLQQKVHTVLQQARDVLGEEVSGDDTPEFTPEEVRKALTIIKDEDDAEA